MHINGERASSPLDNKVVKALQFIFSLRSGEDSEHLILTAQFVFTGIGTVATGRSWFVGASKLVVSSVMPKFEIDYRKQQKDKKTYRKIQTK